MPSTSQSTPVSPSATGSTTAQPTKTRTATSTSSPTVTESSAIASPQLTQNQPAYARRRYEYVAECLRQYACRSRPIEAPAPAAL
jgi:hypothetical protein